ncbi:hypothetical protein [Pseudoroseicyclus sp. CXY001]|uniref:hypothetical protein n=1 Tax=Pseudoroseicyclus sp. CXY001 TaxID=3242492 RepID=UPI003570A818
MQTKFTLAALAAATSLAAAAPALAQEPGSVNVGAGLSTLGATIEGSYQITPEVALRGLANGTFGLGVESTLEDYDFEGDAQIGGVGLLADYYIGGGNFRVSGGVYVPVGELEGTFTSGAQTFDGTARFSDDVAPMATAGYRYAFASGLTLTAEAGAIFSDYEISTNSPNPADQAEADRLNDEANDWGAYPYVALTAGFSF